MNPEFVKFGIFIALRHDEIEDEDMNKNLIR